MYSEVYAADFDRIRKPLTNLEQTLLTLLAKTSSYLNTFCQEEVVHVPKVITQTRVQQQHVEQTIEVPVPMSQDSRAFCCCCRCRWCRCCGGRVVVVVLLLLVVCVVLVVLSVCVVLAVLLFLGVVVDDDVVDVDVFCGQIFALTYA